MSSNDNPNEYLKESIWLSDPTLHETAFGKNSWSRERVEFFPDIDFWKGRVDVKLVNDVFTEDGKVDPVRYREETTFFVNKELFDALSAELNFVKVDQQHIHNLLVPLLKFQRAGESIFLIGVDVAAKDLSNLREVLNSAGRGLIPWEIHFKMPLDMYLDHTDYSTKPSKLESFTLKDPRIIRYFMNFLVEQYKQDGPFRYSIDRSDYNKFLRFNKKTHLKEEQRYWVYMAAEYLQHAGIYKSHSRASTILSAIFSTIGFGMSRSAFYDKQNLDDYSKVEGKWRDKFRKLLEKGSDWEKSQ
jgi:hypothetical protein